MSRPLRSDQDGHAVGCPSENGCDCGYHDRLMTHISKLRAVLEPFVDAFGPDYEYIGEITPAMVEKAAGVLAETAP